MMRADPHCHTDASDGTETFGAFSIHGHGCAERLGQLDAHQPGQQIGRAARRERRDDADRAVRISGRTRRTRQYCCAESENAAAAQHRAPCEQAAIGHADISPKLPAAAGLVIPLARAA